MKKILGDIVIFILGIVMLIEGTVMLVRNYNFTKMALETKATVTNIVLDSRTTKYGPVLDIDVYVEFEVAGEIYEGKLYNYSDVFVNTGDIVRIYYNSKNPNEIKANINSVSSYIGYIFCIINGGILAFIPFVKKINYKLLSVLGMIIQPFIPSVKKINYKHKATTNTLKNEDNYDIINKKRLTMEYEYYIKKRGIKIEASFDEIEHIADKGKCAYKVKCSYTDPKNNKVYKFESEETSLNLNIVIPKNTQKIPVYILENKKSEYFVDVMSVVDNNLLR